MSSKTRQKGTDQDPNQIIHLQLSETETITLIDFPALSVSNENNEELLTVKTANARYKDVFDLFLMSNVL